MTGGIITTTRTDYLARIEAGERGVFDISGGVLLLGGNRVGHQQPGDCAGVSPNRSSTLAGSVKTPGHVLDAAAGLPVSVPFHGGSYA